MRDKREYCAERRVSDKRACGNWLLKGIELNAVAIPLPTFVLRKKVVKSRKPPGVKSAEPILNDSGDLFSFWSRAAPCDAAFGDIETAVIAADLLPTLRDGVSLSPLRAVASEALVKKPRSIRQATTLPISTPRISSDH